MIACKNCNSKDFVKLRRQITKSCVTQFCWYCIACDKVADNQSPWIKKTEIEQWVQSGRLPSIDAIPVARDYSRQVKCAVCQLPGGELHHWMPQAFNNDTLAHSVWPTSYLCKQHHDEWHEIVTWYLPGRIGTERSNVVKERYFPNERNI